MKKSTPLLPPFLKKIRFQRDKNINQDYPLNLPIFQHDFEISLTQPVTIFVGENGTGKSTLIEYIANVCNFNLQGGSQDHIYQTKSLENHLTLQALKPYICLSWLPKVSQGFFMRAETFYNFLEYIYDPEFSDMDYETGYGGYLLEKSHGEAFLSLFNHRFQRGGIYLLDEPEAALSPNRQLAFLKTIRRLEQKRDTQIIIITHSPILMSYPGAQVLLFSHEGIRSCCVEEVENYQLMRDFLANPQKFLKKIMEDHPSII
ncbi:MAG TPA: AAA family ATPase [Candidatus Nitrosotenuis sp.]|jgi:predicted ATPase|nr:AAA family ATPase [Candidatus Nitrosotenuis sp.]